MKRILSLLLILMIVLSCSKDTVTPTPTPEPTPKYSLVIAASEGGSVNSTGGTYEKGTKVTVTATPDGEYLFDSWSDGSTENPREITVTSNLDLTANFIKKKYSLSISTSGEGTVTEEVLVQGSINDYNSGTKVRLTAVPNTDEDWEFIGWEGDVESTNPVIEIDVTEAKAVEAKFMRYFDYLVNSHQYKNNMNPFFDLFDIASQIGLDNSYGGIDTGTAIADFNSDGYLDVLFLVNPGVDGDFCEHFMALNTGDDQTFTKDESLISNPDFQTYMSRKTIVGDFNGDSKPDVVRIAGGHDFLRKSNIFLSGEDAYSFEELDVVPETQYHGFASGDIDQDGDLDLLFGSPKGDMGFAINNGLGEFSWSPFCERVSNCPGNEDLWSIQTVEILDVDRDGYEDLVMGGGYKDNEYDQSLNGPTIFYGDGSGYFNFENITEIWGFGEKPTLEDGNSIGNNDDFLFYDIDSDGYLDFITLYIMQIDEDPQANGNTTMYHYLDVYKGNSGKTFTKYTDEWLPDNYRYCTMVWILVKDIDEDGFIELTEYSKNTQKSGRYPETSCPTSSWTWKWNGSYFESVN